MQAKAAEQGDIAMASTYKRVAQYIPRGQNNGRS